MMRAFVLSGGGNRAALQVGALQLLLERGVSPDLLVGTSPGAVNAAFLASNPTPEGGQRLAEVWQRVTQEDVYQGNRWSVLWRLIRNETSLFSNANFERFLERQLHATHVQHFGDIPSGVRLYIVAARLDTSAAHVFGDDANDVILNALMASTALPPFHAPWHCDGALYVDGGLAANLPVRVAVERGAREIYALHVVGLAQSDAPLRGVLEVAGRVLSAFIEQQQQRDVQTVVKQRGVNLHYIPLTASANLPLWDFGHTAEMIAAGRVAMEAYLDARLRRESPRRAPWQWVQRALAQARIERGKP